MRRQPCHLPDRGTPPGLPTAESRSGPRADHRRPARLVATVLAVLAVSGAVACTGSKQDPSSGPGTSLVADDKTINKLEPDEPVQKGGKLTIGVMAESSGWNTHRALWADAGNFVGSSMLETLAVFDANGDVKPWLLDAFAPAVEGEYDRWILTVHPGISFHDGTPLNAEAVATNLNDARTKSLAAVATGYMFESIEATGPLTVEVRLTQPWASFPSYLANTSGYMMATSMIEAEDGKNDHPIGTGPYQFVNWEPDRSLKVRRFDGYWKGEPNLAEIEFRTIVDNKSRVNGLESGELDMIFTTRAGDIQALIEKDFTVVGDFNSEKAIVMLNTIDDPEKPGANPFTNIHARRALAYATNPAEIRETVGEGLQLKTSTQVQVEGSRWGMDPAQTGALGYDPVKAQEEVAAYERDTGRTGITFSFNGLSSTDDQQVQQLLKQQWSQVGITAEINTLEQAAYITQQASGLFQAAFFRNYAYPDPDSDYYFFSSLTAKGVRSLSVNFHQFRDPEIDKVLDEARRTTDVSVRKERYETLTRRVNEGVIDIWLFNTPYALVADADVRGLNPARVQPFGNFLSKQWLWVSIWTKQ